MKGMITVLDQKNVRTFYDLSRIKDVPAIGIHPSEEGGRPPADILENACVGDFILCIFENACAGDFILCF